MRAYRANVVFEIVASNEDDARDILYNIYEEQPDLKYMELVMIRKTTPTEDDDE